MTKYDDHRIQRNSQLRELYKRGLSVSEISRQLEISHATVKSWLIRENIVPAGFKHSPGAPRGNKNAVGGPGNPHPAPPQRNPTVVLQIRLNVRTFEDLQAQAKQLGWPVARLVRRLLESIDGLMAMDALVLEELTDREKRPSKFESGAVKP